VYRWASLLGVWPAALVHILLRSLLLTVSSTDACAGTANSTRVTSLFVLTRLVLCNT
jgi:hypothetical protein